MAITAAAVVPMLGVVGGGIDISRIYLARSRLQAACDAGVLAGRKAMTTPTYTQAARDRTNGMFNFNYQDVDYGTSILATRSRTAGQTSPTPDNGLDTGADPDGRLNGTATRIVPMVLMQIFGVSQQTITVKCSADIQVPNIDIVFVLDVTGSMNDPINGTKKIDSLKSATKGFYDTIRTALAGNTRSQVRYGFVPYSQSVNVKELFVNSPDASIGQLPLSHLTSNMIVESRVANFNTPVPQGWVRDTSVAEITFNQIYNLGDDNTRYPNSAANGSGTNISNNDCQNYGNNYAFTIDSIGERVFFPGRTSFPGDGNGDNILYKPEGSNAWQASEPTTGNSYTRASFERNSDPSSWYDNNGQIHANYTQCRRKVTLQKYIRQTGFKFTNWTYKQVPVDVSGFKAGSTINYTSWVDGNYTVQTAGSYTPVQMRQFPNQSGLGQDSTQWNGCIEERDTTAANSFSPIPSAAKDLNYKVGGTSDDLRWRPVLQKLTYNRSTSDEVTTTDYYGNPDHTCPGASIRNLRTYTETQFDSFVDGLSPGGYTYLDLGMVWGLRLISSQGMWASRNQTGPNGGQIARHIIFLTDGEPVSAIDSYSGYGVERMAKRVKGNLSTDMATLHSRRFQALCDAERGKVTIWAVAFGTSVTGNMSNCADPTRAMQANNTTELNTAFTRIANDVADLRLVQ